MSSEFYPAEAYDKLAEVESGHWWFRSRNRILIWLMKKYVPDINTFLEVGCGTGFVLQAVQKNYPNAKLFASEYFKEGLVHASKRVPSAKFNQLDARNMVDNKIYDVIGAFDVIEHIEEDELVLSNFFRALKKKGLLFLTVPQHPWLWSAADEHACHVRRYKKKELIKKVKDAGFSIEYVSSFVSLLVPLMWLNRKKGKDSKYNPMDEFLIPRWLNKSLEKMMLIELGLLKIKIKLPIGGSLIMLAKKNN